MRRGFTLIELLVVLVIISLVSAFVAPRITAPMGNLQLKTASKKIAGAMRYSRSLAVSEKVSRICLFNFDKQQISIFSETALDPEGSGDEPATGPAEIQYKLPEGIFFKKAIAGDLNVAEGLFKVVFFTNGSASGGDVFLANDKGRASVIHIDFITGMVALTTPEQVG